MTLPSWGRRALLRTLVAGAVAGVLVAALGFIAERARFGGDVAAARAKVDADVRAQFDALAGRLAVAVQEVAREAPSVPAAIAGDTDAVRALFNRIDRAQRVAALAGMALTVYGPVGRPLAWMGRAAPIPAARLDGPAALYLAPGPAGLRLVRVEPVAASPPAPGGVIVAETPLPTVTTGGVSDGLMLDTSVIPVPIFARVGLPDESDSVIVIPASGGEPLAAVMVPERDVAAARAVWRTRVGGALLVVLAVTLLLLIGPLLDWRRLVGRPRLHIALTAVVVGLLVTARAVLWTAVRLFGLATPALAPADSTGGFWWLLLASPIDFLLTASLACALATIGSSTYDQWRHGRWWSMRVLSEAGATQMTAFLVAQLLAGALAGALIVIYQKFLGERLSRAPVDIVHFALGPWEPDRIAVAIGLVMLHAAVLVLTVVILRFGIAVWIVPTARRGLRLSVPVLWLAGGLAVALLVRPADGARPLVPATLAIAFAATAAFTVGRYRAWLRHASQALRLGALFTALALPSFVFYPSLMDAAGRARRHTIETRYAPEVANQRTDLQLHLARAQQQIDSLVSLPDLIEAAEPVVTAGTPPTDAAFAVWSQTALAEERLTSSVELYDAQGTLVSRFALKLPETSGAQEGKCDWEIFEEVSPFFAEERRLLHADRGICVADTEGRMRKVGSLVIHLMAVDYSNLSFISAQSPYAALMRSPTAKPIESTPPQLEFVVYGWSRRPLYISGRDAWPLDQSLFERAQATREPFWAEVVRGGTRYQIYFLNDRFGIYALGYPQVSGFDHLMTLAELVTLVGVTFVALLIGGALYGRVALRTPVSGRALLREVRASFYRKLFLAFVLAAVIPVLALAVVTRAYIAALIQADIETEAGRTAGSASRVVEDFGSLQARGGATTIDDNLVVWLSRVIAQDVNIFDGWNLLASSERNLFASGLLPTRTPGDVYRAIMLDARASYLGRENVGGPEYLVAAAPVRLRNRQAILTVPLTLRQQEIQAQIDELDRRVLLATLAFILLGAAIGYSMAERIADPVNRLTRATQRIARGDLDARVLATSSDEFRRLVEAFNRMAADLQRQRGELERTNRLAAWADMARQVAHDIKNPLTPIQLNAEHLRRVHIDHGEPLGRIVDECMTNILTQVRLLRQIAGEFSSFASSPTPRPAPTMVGEVLQEVLEPYRIGLADRVTIETRIAEDLPALFVDRTLLGRALTNIIENALHAMPGGGHLRAFAETDAAGHVVIGINDTGVGMDADSLKRIFEPYFSTKASGTGLGLTIAKRNIELNGGTIEVTSTRGVGTTVRLLVPIVKPSPVGTAR